MAGEPMSYWDYVKAAFWKPVRSRVLGAMPLTQMLLVSFGLAGFVNPGFWLLGLAAIVAFVGGRSASERFQKLVEAERLAARAGERRGPDEGGLRAAAAGVAGPLPGARGRRAARSSASAPAATRAGSPTSAPGNLNQMLWLFLRLLASRESITDTLARVDRRQLESGLETLKARARGGRRPRGRPRPLAQGDARDPGEAPRQPGHRHQQPRGDRRRARADRAAGAPGARGERRQPARPRPSRRGSTPSRRRSARPRAGWTSTRSSSPTSRATDFERRARPAALEPAASPEAEADRAASGPAAAARGAAAAMSVQPGDAAPGRSCRSGQPVLAFFEPGGVCTPDPP